MARNVTYSVVPRYNPSKKGTPPKYYAQSQASGEVDVREMAERIQQNCTVTKADVHAVLVAMEDVIILALKSGEMIRLGDLGTFQIGVSSKGAETEEDFNVSLIKKARINFRPGVALSSFLSSLTYAKVAKRAVPEDTEKEEEESGEEA